MTENEVAEQDEPATDTPEAAPVVAATRRPGRWVTVIAVLTLAALIFAAVSALTWRSADNNESLRYAKARDAVALSARQDIVVLNTLSYTDVAGGLQSWLAASTGTLHDQISSVSAADKTAIAAAKTKTTGKVIDAAVTQLDDRAGSATVIAAVEVTVTPASGKATTKRNRFSATMTRIGPDWKLSDLQQVAVTTS